MEIGESFQTERAEFDGWAKCLIQTARQTTIPGFVKIDVTDRLLWRYGNRIDAGDPVSTFKSPSNLLSRSMRQRTRSFTAWFTALVLIVQSLAASALTRPLADARPGVVEGQVWVDSDSDGIYGPDEDALGGVRL